jgi:hypothetical protein
MSDIATTDIHNNFRLGQFTMMSKSQKGLMLGSEILHGLLTNQGMLRNSEHVYSNGVEWIIGLLKGKVG